MPSMMEKNKKLAMETIMMRRPDRHLEFVRINQESQLRNPVSASMQGVLSLVFCIDRHMPRDLAGSRGHHPASPISRRTQARQACRSCVLHRQQRSGLF